MLRSPAASPSSDGLIILSMSHPAVSKSLTAFMDSILRIQANSATSGTPCNARRLQSALARASAEGRSARPRGLTSCSPWVRTDSAILQLDEEEFALAVRLQSRDEVDREWRRSLGAKARRLDSGEAASIAIATRRSMPFASDDDDALILWGALTAAPGLRTIDLMRQVVQDGRETEANGRAMYEMLQTDDLHNLGGPAW